MGESCVPNLMLLPFSTLMEWCAKRQQHLEWTNQTLAEKSKIPIGTIKRIKAGEEDCKFSTMRSILIALIGGTTDEFACTEQVEKELKQMERLEQQAAKLTATEAECEMLRDRLNRIDEQHRQDIRIVREEYHDQITFLKDELKAWRSFHQKHD
jgi:ATP-dependent protease HslVU (ClpYQ) peptidase subunit